MTDIRVPDLGESVTEATVAQWFKQEGDAVEADEPLVELETDKVTLEVPAPASGVIAKISVKEGDTVQVGSVLGSIEEGEAPVKEKREPGGEKAPPSPAREEPEERAVEGKRGDGRAGQEREHVAPSVRRIVEENDLDLSEVDGTGRGGRVTKADALAALERRGEEDERERARTKEARPERAERMPAAEARRAPESRGEAREERVPMTRLRQTIARRLKEAQDTAAMLTTFNEVDMSHIMAVRAEYKDIFERRHNVRLGFMSFFVKACVVALREIPAVNAEIEDRDIIYKNYYDIGVAVGTERGLLVPVLRDADRLSLAEIEKKINDFGRRAREGQISLEELQGGTFTISNGGVYGSLLSTPILNAPQSGILGMHKIEQRAVVIDGEITVR
ncbi:MAG: 2-oxoglutarate dehydrogenase complex dihydrolipoyllysine-residue succinyltransferase, partial [Alphaproteobacteria bacterium]